MRSTSRILLALSAFVVSACDFPVSITRIDPEQFSNSRADAAISAANAIILDGSNSTTNVACGATLARSGGVATYLQPSGGDLHNIDTPEEMTMLLNGPPNGYAKIVDQIDACGTVMDTGITGCAVTGGLRMVIEDVRDNPTRDGASFEAITWAHEFAHTRGVGHRPMSSSTLNIMHPTPLTTANRLSSTECTQMLNGPQISFTPTGSIAGQPESEEGAVSDMPLEEFVKLRYIDAVPFEQASQYGVENVPMLLDWLGDRAHRDEWGMITLVLGAIGDEGAVGGLIEFIEQDRGLRTPRVEYSAVSGALRSLGLIVARTGSPQALEYLWESSDPQGWSSRTSMRWTSAYLTTLQQRNQRLARYAVMGLGLSGNAEARGMLQRRWQEMQSSGGSGTHDQQSGMLQILEQSMEHNERIARDGLFEYYRFD